MHLKYLITILILFFNYKKVYSEISKIPSLFAPINEVISSCQNNCLNKYSEQFESLKYINYECRKSEDCFSCWEFCKFLYTLEQHHALDICNNRDLCQDGCKYACNHFRIRNSSRMSLWNALRRLEMGQLKFQSRKK